ncbi:hypothetical protein MXD63_34670 [Frankia sp. Cpl3]|nr:hypothetical protein [Parafrankia colletiae]MCK9905141.1 hypothetical protein [Frankia sp. Cpl3]
MPPESGAGLALDAVAVPAGWWVRSPGDDGPSLDDPAFVAVPDPDGRTTLIIGRPGSPPPTAAALAALMGGLPEARRDEIVLSVYGSVAADGEPGGLPQRLAELTGRPLLVRHGLLLADAHGAPCVVAVADDGGPPWRPFGSTYRYAPATAPVLLPGHLPLPGLDEQGPGTYRLVDDWVVRLVPAGLLTGREASPPSADPQAGPPARAGGQAPGVAGAMPGTGAEPGVGVGAGAELAAFDPAHLDLAVEGPAAELTDAVLAALGRLTDELPAPARRRLRVVLPAGATEDEARRVRWAIPAPQRVLPVPAPQPPVAGPQPPVAGPRSPAAAEPPRAPAAEQPAEPAEPAEPRAMREAATVLAVTADGRMSLVSPPGRS